MSVSETLITARAALEAAGYRVIAPGEPVFVLRAQDILAPSIVRIWAHAAAVCRASDEKVASALDIAEAMEDWPTRKVPD